VIKISLKMLKDSPNRMVHFTISFRIPF
jgi:hypothetical protein